MYSHKRREIKTVKRHISFYSAECIFEVTAVASTGAQEYSARDPSQAAVRSRLFNASTSRNPITSPTLSRSPWGQRLKRKKQQVPGTSQGTATVTSRCKVLPVSLSHTGKMLQYSVQIFSRRVRYPSVWRVDLYIVWEGLLPVFENHLPFSWLTFVSVSLTGNAITVYIIYEWFSVTVFQIRINNQKLKQQRC